MHDPSAVTTYLFTDIEGSTRLWEREPARMHAALACHDALARRVVEANGGTVVKTIGDGVHAAFANPQDALRATVELQRALADPAATNGVPLKIRCGLHAGVDNRRDNDFFGTGVNRAARIMNAAHGGQILVSGTVANLVGAGLPEGVALRDLGTVRLRDLAQPERIYQVMHPELRPTFPTLRSLEATPNNLPQQLTSFVGREHEVRQVRTMLRESRLLTILGIGGLGKSRLSLQVAAQVQDDYPDGVWFVELAPVADARLVPQTVATILGVKEEAGSPVLDALAKFVRDRSLLLVLDNCEHVIQACAELSRTLLEAGPQVRVLATSREHLNIRGEKSYPLAPLVAPGVQQKLSIDAVAQFAAVRLFVERAVAAQPAFALTDDNVGAVVAICHRLDGIPLALELAAARMRAMSVDKIAARLTDRFRLLGGGDRTALPRQQTLRALIDWSHDLLAEDERALFRRLAVFAGGFALEAAEQVTAGAPIAEEDVLDLLTRLVEKSLVALDAGGERYRLLETVREYAQHRLAESGETAAVGERHLDWCLAFAEQAAAQIAGPQQGKALALLDLERENIVAAHAACDRSPAGGPKGLRLVRAIRNYCFRRGLLALAYGATVEALARPGAQARDFARCRALSDAAQFATRLGRGQDALQFVEESLAIARELGDKSRIEAVLQPLGMIYLAQGDAATAQRLLEEALGLARELGNEWEVIAALSCLVQIHRASGALDAALPLCDQVVAQARKLGNAESICIGLLNRAMVSIARGVAEPVPAMLLETHALVAETDARTTGQCLLEVVAGLAASRGDWAAAARVFGAAEAVGAQSGLRRDAADEAFLMPLIDATRAALGADRFASVAAAGGGLSYADAMREAHAWLTAHA